MAIDCVSKHTAFIFDRGGTKRLFQLKDLAEVRWDRRRDDISEANVKISAERCFKQENELVRIEPHRHELVLFRGQERVWEGPITRLGFDAEEMEIHAGDVMHYLSRTIMRNAYNNAYPFNDYAIERIKDIVIGELTRKRAQEIDIHPDLPDYNILPHVVFHQKSTDAKTARKTPRFHKTVWEELDDMAAKGGVDYTVVGRAIHFWDTHEPLGQTRVATQSDFQGRLKATVYGMDLATLAAVTDGEGVFGLAGIVDPFYGLVENLETAYDETEGADPPTSAEMASQAQRNLVGRNPAPLVIRVPDNASISPDGVFTMADLVPGVFIPLRAKILIRTFNQMQKLDKMAVIETPEDEKITVVMSPAPGPIEEVEEP